MTAADNVAIATSALSLVNRLIEAEAADAAEDANEGSTEPAGEDAADVTLLRGIATSLTKYIALTTDEIGTSDDLEEIADEAREYSMNERIRAASGRTI